MQTTPVQDRPFAPPKRAYSAADWQKGNKSLKEEFDYPIEEIEGEIPPQLHGTLFRNIPAMLDVNGHQLRHPFDADGMVCAIAFSEGRAHFRNRYVRTKGFIEEQKAGKILYRGVFGTQKPGGWLANAFDFRLKNVANTNVIHWGGKLMALWEASHPHRLDPHTLETLGIETLGGTLQKGTPFAAHPMMDPGDETRPQRLVTFGLEAGLSSTLTIYELDETGRVVKQHKHSLPGFSFIHDFAITPNYCLFFQNPLFFNPIPFVLGLRGAAECMSFQEGKPTKVWIIPRDESKEVQVLETESGFVFHHANAFERGDEIIVDSICYKNYPAIDHRLTYKDLDEEAMDNVPPGQLWRFRLNLKAKTAERQRIDRRTVDFPYIHPERIGKPHRWIFLGAADQPYGNAPLQALLKIDPESGEQEMWSAAPKGFIEEPVFVPRSGSTEEDDGWVMTLVYDADRDRTDVVIFEGKQISQGPIARLHLKHHIPYGLHGCFAPGVTRSEVG
jgi:all-trans-8'-apo-beta-carotenal 15,15'-oxygenase